LPRKQLYLSQTNFFHCYLSFIYFSKENSPSAISKKSPSKERSSPLNPPSIPESPEESIKDPEETSTASSTSLDQMEPVSTSLTGPDQLESVSSSLTDPNQKELLPASFTSPNQKKPDSTSLAKLNQMEPVQTSQPTTCDIIQDSASSDQTNASISDDKLDHNNDTGTNPKSDSVKPNPKDETKSKGQKSGYEDSLFAT
jgi:hypothetical protein